MSCTELAPRKVSRSPYSIPAHIPADTAHSHSSLVFVKEDSRKIGPNPGSDNFIIKEIKRGTNGPDKQDISNWKCDGSREPQRVNCVGKGWAGADRTGGGHFFRWFASSTDRTAAKPNNLRLNYVTSYHRRIIHSKHTNRYHFAYLSTHELLHLTHKLTRSTLRLSETYNPRNPKRWP